MTMTDKENIRAEIEEVKLIIQANRAQGAFAEGYLLGQESVVEHLEKFIDSMPEEPVSEDLEEASKEWLIPQLDKSYASYGENMIMELTHFDGYAMLDAIEFGAQWQKQQLMKSAVKGVVHHFGDDEIAAIHYNDPKGVPMSYFVSSNDLKAGDNVKMITIKED